MHYGSHTLKYELICRLYPNVSFYSLFSDTSYDYAVPEVATGTLPLLTNDSPPLPLVQEKDSLYHSKGSARSKEDKPKKVRL